MVVFCINESLREFVVESGLADACVTHDGGVQTVAHRVLDDALKKTNSKRSLFELVAGAEAHLSHSQAAAVFRAPPQRSPEMEAHFARIRLANEEREYAKMVHDVAHKSSSNAEAESMRMGRLGAQMSIGANVIVAMATCFVAGYFVFKHSTGSETSGLIGGVACMIAIMAVEAILIIARMYSIETAAEKEAQNKYGFATRSAQSQGSSAQSQGSSASPAARPES